MTEITGGYENDRKARETLDNIENIKYAVSNNHRSSDFFKVFPPEHIEKPYTSHTLHTSPTAQEPSQTFSTVSLEAVPQHAIDWLYKPLLPKGAVTILYGAKRTGKTTFAEYLGASLSKEHKVLIVEREDPEFLIKSRLIAMKANVNNIRLYRSINRTSQGESIQMPFGKKDLANIIQAAENFKAELVIIDPLHALAQGKMNDQSSADCLVDLTAFAQRNNASVLGVMHSKKDAHDVETAMSGSEQWAAKCRSLAILAVPPGDEEHAILEQVNISYGKTQNFRLTFRQVPLKDDNGKDFSVRVVAESEPTEDSVQDILRIKENLIEDRTDPDEITEIAEWLRSTLLESNSATFARTVQESAKREHTWKPAQLRRAYAQAKICQTKTSAYQAKSILYLSDKINSTQAKNLLQDS